MLRTPTSWFKTVCLATRQQKELTGISEGVSMMSIKVLKFLQRTSETHSRAI